MFAQTWDSSPHTGSPSSPPRPPAAPYGPQHPPRWPRAARKPHHPAAAPPMGGKLPEVGFSVGGLTLIFQPLAPRRRVAGSRGAGLGSTLPRLPLRAGAGGGSRTQAACPPAQAGPCLGDSVGTGSGKRPSQVAGPGHKKATLSGPRAPAPGHGRPGRFPGLGKLGRPLAVLSRERASPPAGSQGLAQGPGCWVPDGRVAPRFSRKRAAWGDQREACPAERGEPQGSAGHLPGGEERKERRAPGGLPGRGGVAIITVGKRGFLGRRGRQGRGGPIAG